jgi:hypothetical protein
VHHENIHTATANSVTNVARPETTPTAAAAQSDGVGSMGGRARGILRDVPLFDIENLTATGTHIDRLSILETEKNKGGRPRTFATPLLVRIAPDLLGKLDEWIEEQEDKPSRVEAIRRILTKALRRYGPRGS